MHPTIIKNARIVNEGEILEGDVLIHKGRIEKIGGIVQVSAASTEIDATGKFLMPGIIDDQVHFREPGLTHKADLFSESRACVAGGVTSFMDMPNVNPPSLTQELLAQRYALASTKSVANYSFYMGVSNDNADEVLRTDPATVCGIKIFMGSSTGNMLVDDAATLERIFSQAPVLIATHCEDEATIIHNLEAAKATYGEDIPVHMHPIIRNEEACYRSSSFAVSLAKKHNTRLHILHISTAEELALFTNEIPLEQKRITAEACVHHMYFDSNDYAQLGARIKWNPAVKGPRHKPAIFDAVVNDVIDVIATDHAPHTLEEKANKYVKCPGGAPMVQHSLQVMLSFYFDGKISLEKIAKKMSHDVATCFNIKDRGFIREGYFADMFLLDTDKSIVVSKNNIIAKCGWSPLEGRTMRGVITDTFVNGDHVFSNGMVNDGVRGMRLAFNR
ncbi:MAG TPA: dihydroorotase [Chitinophagales bacterium]|nr:dihydroorotase [Chitinophagales bacterium]HMU69931.1 dihydroorotase [Chitinophagales bacterium]HMX03372.1 dihydroorotase [Chitinophagales bacterium]HMZ90606.1 dihydroorotase [Chitinophagales bacterium]HNA58176.1 dihydroorotase [Chitinophagales bacterium]